MKAQQQPARSTSAMLSAIMFIITFSVMQVSAEFLRQSPAFISLGGFLGSLLFFFTMVILGSLRRESGWLDVIVSMVVAMACASTVHRISVTTCFLFSSGLLFWMNVVAGRVNNKQVTQGRK
eukprot:TRINITY_DN5337_c0_g1_i1.p1 TRINITY_DN5337_c0_g1~~TRINITY_DN5337_c0_g1_i1.p1  ORF type:complete len:122 (+),score=21.65 TRINITY_DN5337_c0_g1_i1:28-393(+)